MEDAEQFDWADKRSIVVRRVDAIAIYINDEGDIIIRQQHAHQPLDSIVTIPAHSVYAVLERLQRHVKAPFAAPFAAAVAA